MEILSAILILGGMFFLAISAVGFIRLPDFYTRAHAGAKSETLGAILTLGGLAIYNGFAVTSLKLLVILVFVAIANSTAMHLVARAALQTGLEPWTREKTMQSEQGQ